MCSDGAGRPCITGKAVAWRRDDPQPVAGYNVRTRGVRSLLRVRIIILNIIASRIPGRIGRRHTLTPNSPLVGDLRNPSG